ncbi:MAG TPA: hypothetical protein VK670_03690, partial [Silvibacterium sp.]|nr:hypothetical protein [Silvibacterium sp.]
MDYLHLMVCGLLGFGPGWAIFCLLRAKRRARIPPAGWWLSLILGAVIFVYGESHSTMPSFAPRITAVGKAYDYVQRELGAGRHRDTIYGFRFVPEGGEPINIETKISLHGVNPDTGLPEFFNG